MIIYIILILIKRYELGYVLLHQVLGAVSWVLAIISLLSVGKQLIIYNTVSIC